MSSETVLTITIPTELAERYREQAKSSKNGLESLLSDRLARAVDWDASKPLYFNDKQRRELEGILGKNFKDADEVLRVIQKYLTVRLNGTMIPIQPQLLKRLETRCFGKTFDRFLVDTVTEGLERFCGIR